MLPNRTEIAILKTLLYGDLFDYPMTVREIHHFLIEEKASLEQVATTLEGSPWLAQHVTRVNGYYATRPETATLRHERSEISQKLWQQAQRYGIWLAYLPFVRMVALTGALAMHNASSPHDDFDYLVITTPGRVWMTRLLAIVMVRVARLWGVELCPNYVMSAAALHQTRQNLYIARELVQMVPISGHTLYEEMRAVNGWSAALIPNAQGCFHATPPHTPHGIGRLIQRSAEWLLGGRLGDWLEQWEQRRKQRKFALEAANSPHSAAEIDAERVKGHFQDYGHPILNRFYNRLNEYAIDHQKAGETVERPPRTDH